MVPVFIKIEAMAILKTIEKKELDLFMFIGDNVYGDQKDGELDKLIRTYKQQYNNLENFLKCKYRVYLG